MYFVYILQSQSRRIYYVGQTADLMRRISQHNLGRVRSTKKGIPWSVVYTEQIKKRGDAIKRERQIKSYKSGEAFKKLVHGH
jgi:putative endonuclease